MSTEASAKASGNPVLDHLDLWSSVTVKKAAVGRGSNGNLSPYGIQKLRELILELAVRGELVSQLADDGSAEELLVIAKERKAELLKDKVIRRTKAPAPYDEDPEQELPRAWVLTTLYDLGVIGPRNSLGDDEQAAFVPMEKISDRYGVPVEYEVRAWEEIKSGFTHFRDNDVVLAKITPCFQNGKSCVMKGLKNGAGAGTTELHVFQPIPDTVVPEFVLLFLKSPGFILEGIPRMTGTAGQKRITRDYFAGKPFPLPPLAEQHRIVAKVDELMALCDQLEQQQTDSLQAHQTLVETVLRTLVEAGDAESTQQAWNRTAEHFDTLFITEESIDQLKQTILQLAVMGRLVPQDPNDEPASLLLEKIAADEERLIKEGKIRKKKPLPKIADDEKPFEIPTGWEWIRLQDASALITKGSSPKWQGVEYVQEGEGVLFVTSENVGNYDLRLANLKYVEQKFNEIEPRSILEVGDILMNIVGASIGRTAVFDLEDTVANINQAVCVIRLIGTCEDELRAYLLHFLNSDFGLQLMFGNQVENARANLSMSNIANFPIPLPPLAEQHRIVAKVDELMALCDTLKASIQQAQSTQVNLADAVVEQAVG